MTLQIRTQAGAPSMTGALTTGALSDSKDTKIPIGVRSENITIVDQT